MAKAKNPFFSARTPGGIQVIADQQYTTGDYFFVSSAVSGATDSAGFGSSPESPFATIDFAIGQCTANNSDVILVMPGHADTVSAAAGIAADVAGATVQGIGVGTLQPMITLDTDAAADIDIDAANFTFRNIHFRANFADIVAAIDVNATDFTLDGCRFSEVATDMNALIWVQDAAAAASDRITIRNCRGIGLLDAANTHFVNFAGTGTGHLITGNTLIGDWGTMAIGGAGIVTYCEISHNQIMNEASDNDACINVAATATGIIAYNACGGAAAQANGIASGDCIAIENYYGVHTEDLSGILDPIAT